MRSIRYAIILFAIVILLPQKMSAAVAVDPPYYTGTSYNDNSLSLTYQGTWENVLNTGTYPYLGGYHKGTVGSSVQFAFNGNTITYMYETGPAFGKAEVFIDNKLVEIINQNSLYSKSQVSQSWTLSAGNHTIDIKLANGASGYFNIDAFIVDILPTNIVTPSWLDNTTTILMYQGALSGINGATGAIQNTLLEMSSGRGWWVITPAQSFTYYYTQSPNYDKVVITVDGEEIGIIDQESQNQVHQKWINFDIDANGKKFHTIHVMTIPNSNNQILNTTNLDALTFNPALDTETALSIEQITYTVREGNTLQVKIKLSTAVSYDVSVAYKTTSLSAVGCNINQCDSIDDYINTQGSVIFSAGQTEKVVSIPITTGDVTEGTEFFALNLYSPSNASINEQNRYTRISILNRPY